MAQTVVSSKGQVVIPEKFRKDLKWIKGTKVSVQRTSSGIMLFSIPKKPLLAIQGLLKGTGVSTNDIFNARKKDFEHDKKEFL